MSGVGHRAAILTLARFANYGLMILSPVILTRLLTVGQFGRYREFLLYTSVLSSLAVFSINDSLLYFVPAHPQSRWRTVRQTAALIGASSLTVVTLLIVADRASGGGVVGTFLWPLCAYVLVSSNLDFWDYYWVATDRPGLVFGYSAVRLAARVTVATGTAALTHSVRDIIWALIGLESLRVLAVAGVMLRIDASAREPPLREPWREQLRYCLPSGAASALAMLNGNLAGLVVARVLGAVALAQFAIGRFGDPLVVTLRNSVSSVVLPEMVRRGRSREGPLALWRRATVVNTLALFPVVVLVLRFATPLVVTVFGAAYAPAATVLKIYMLVVVRDCFDFAPALRAVNRTRPLLLSNTAAILATALLLAVLVPAAGIDGAIAAFALGTWVDALCLAVSAMRHYGVGFGALIPWRSVLKVALAALAAAAVLATSLWGELLGAAGMVPAAALYLGVFALLALALRVPEGQLLLERLRRLIPSLTAALRRT